MYFTGKTSSGDPNSKNGYAPNSSVGVPQFNRNVGIIFGTISGEEPVYDDINGGIRVKIAIDGRSGDDWGEQNMFGGPVDRLQDNGTVVKDNGFLIPLKENLASIRLNPPSLGQSVMIFVFNGALGNETFCIRCGNIKDNYVSLVSQERPSVPLMFGAGSGLF